MTTPAHGIRTAGGWLHPLERDDTGELSADCVETLREQSDPDVWDTDELAASILDALEDADA